MVSVPRHLQGRMNEKHMAVKRHYTRAPCIVAAVLLGTPERQSAVV